MESMDQDSDPDDRFSTTKGESELASTVLRVLSDGSRAEIDKLLLQDAAYDLKRPYGPKGDTVYQLILTNDKLTEDDIIAISEKFRTRGVNPHARNREKYAKTAVHYAIRNRMRKVTDFFIRCRRRRGYVPNTTFTKFFIEDENNKFWHPVRLNYDEEQRKSEVKMESESASFLQWLISREPDFERGNNQRVSSTAAATGYNLQHLLPVLLRRTTEPSERLAIILHRFLEKNRQERKRPRFNTSKLWYCSYSSRYAAEIVKILLDKGAAARDHWTEYVRLAIKGRDDIRIIKLFIDHFTSGRAKSNIATRLLHELMEYPVDDFTASEIHYYRLILRDLAAKGADVEKKDPFLHWTPIQVAVDNDNVHAAGWLNEIGADFAVLTEHSENLLHLLVAERSAALMLESEKRNANAREVIFDVLVDRGCDVNARNSKGASPLHLAAMFKDKKMARKLIERGADVDCRDRDMMTPLHYAAINFGSLMPHGRVKTVEMIELLLEKGANVNAKDSKAESFFFQAVAGITHDSIDLEILKLLVKSGAQVNALYGFKEGTVMGLAEKIDVDTFQEFLKYGLDVNDSRFCNFLSRRFKKLVELHCVKLKTAKLACSKDYSSRGGDTQKCQRYCLKEIGRMKASFIDSGTSVYRFLHTDIEGRCMHVNNDKLKALVDSPNLRTQFPLYSTIILASYRVAAARLSLLKPAKAAWFELTEISLPDICIERVLSFLENVDLVNMIAP